MMTIPCQPMFPGMGSGYQHEGGGPPHASRYTVLVTKRLARPFPDRHRGVTSMSLLEIKNLHVATEDGIEIVRTPFRVPQANGVAERFVRTARSECLDWMLILNQEHLARVLVKRRLLGWIH